jgi:hypothetical protein
MLSLRHGTAAASLGAEDDLLLNLATALACALPRDAVRIEPAQAPHCPHCGGQRCIRIALPREQRQPPAGCGDTS